MRGTNCVERDDPGALSAWGSIESSIEMSEITKLEPKLVWELFDAITRVPRPSKKEEKIREFLVDFAKKHNITLICHGVFCSGNRSL